MRAFFLFPFFLVADCLTAFHRVFRLFHPTPGMVIAMKASWLSGFEPVTHSDHSTGLIPMSEDIVVSYGMLPTPIILIGHYMQKNISEQKSIYDYLKAREENSSKDV